MELKSLLIRCSATFLLLMCLITTFSSDYSVYASEKLNHAKYGGAVVYAEETEWKYRVVDGKPQKRLWSITYARWLTDWEWV